MTLRSNSRLGAIALVLALTAFLSPTLAAPGDLPAKVQVEGRTAVITLPYRTSEKLIWVSATRMIDAAPFMFKTLDIKPHAGPQGSDLSVFTYVADRAGTTTLTFGLVPPGKVLIGPPTMVYKGPVARKLSLKVTVK